MKRPPSSIRHIISTGRGSAPHYRPTQAGYDYDFDAVLGRQTMSPRQRQAHHGRKWLPDPCCLPKRRCTYERDSSRHRNVPMRRRVCATSRWPDALPVATTVGDGFRFCQIVTTRSGLLIGTGASCTYLTSARKSCYIQFHHRLRIWECYFGSITIPSTPYRSVVSYANAVAS
jgi:hypothetical protein